MAEFLQMVGPEAIQNFLQNWPFAAIVVGSMWFLWRQLIHCYGKMEAITEKLLDDHLSNGSSDGG